MSMREAFRFRVTTMGIVMIPVAVGINFVGKEIANALNLPMWLDSIGTILAAAIAGPWIGAISGAVNNVFFGLTMDGGISIWYALTSVGLAIVAGILGYNGWFKTLPRAVLAAVVLALTAAIISTPLNVILWGGTSGKVLGDGIFATLKALHWGVWLSAFVDEVTMDLIDKVVNCVLVFSILLGLPKRFVQSFQASTKTIRA